MFFLCFPYLKLFFNIFHVFPVWWEPWKYDRCSSSFKSNNDDETSWRKIFHEETFFMFSQCGGNHENMIGVLFRLNQTMMIKLHEEKYFIAWSLSLSCWQPGGCINISVYKCIRSDWLITDILSCKTFYYPTLSVKIALVLM